MNKLFYLFILCLIFSCHDDDDNNSSSASLCMGSSKEAILLNGCSEINENFCSTFYLGEHRLSESSKKFLGQYCATVGSTIIYANDIGGEIIFKITQKNFLFATSTYSIEGSCPEDSTKLIGRCIEVETANINMVSTDPLSFSQL